MPTTATHGELRLSDVRVGYRHTRRWPVSGTERVIVDRVEAEAAAGRVTAVLGPNGVGKSTLLRSVAGLQPMLAGAADLRDDAGRDHDLLRMSPRERARRLAVLLTDRVDAGLLTGREVVELGRHPYQGLVGRLNPYEHRLIAKVLEDLNASELADERFAELSDGQKQRLLLARALVTEPELLILDEPSAFLDVGARVDLMALLGRIARDRMITIVLSTHEVELALRMADQLWLIHDHQLTAGTRGELISSGLIARVFGTGHAVFDPHTGTFGVRD